jgi:hypothetical protein
VATT